MPTTGLTRTASVANNRGVMPDFVRVQLLLATFAGLGANRQQAQVID